MQTYSIKDGLHLLDSGKQFLAKNFVFNFLL